MCLLWRLCTSSGRSTTDQADDDELGKKRRGTKDLPIDAPLAAFCRNGYSGGQKDRIGAAK